MNWKIRPCAFISRQRYWGTPIPVLIHCDACGAVPVPEHDLPVELSRCRVRARKSAGNISFLRQRYPPRVWKDARRETDTMDTFMDSSWYFRSYTDALNDERETFSGRCRSLDAVDFIAGALNMPKCI